MMPVYFKTSEKQYLKKALRVTVLCCLQPSTVFIFVVNNNITGGYTISTISDTYTALTDGCVSSVQILMVTPGGGVWAKITGSKLVKN